MKLTKENLNEVYNDPELNIYCNGEIVDGFSEEDIINAIDNNATVEYYKSTEPTVDGVIKEQITTFIKDHWEPIFYMNKLKNGNSLAELSLLGPTSLEDLVNGVLFNLSVISKILPKEASEWYRRMSEEFLNVIHFRVTAEEMSKIDNVDNRLVAMNDKLAKMLDDYNQHNKIPAYMKFANMLMDRAPVNQPGKALKDLIISAFHPNVFYVESERKWATGYVIGNVVSEMVYILGITHKEAVERFSRANDVLNNILQFDVNGEYFRIMLKEGRGPKTEKMLANSFAVHITKYLEKETGGKYDSNPLIDRFISELKTPSKKEN